MGCNEGYRENMKADIEEIVLPMPKLQRHPLSKKFHEALQRIGELHDKKQSDYGKADDPFANIRSSSEWGISPWVAALIRLNDKVKRLQKAAKGGTLSNEGVVDSLEDIAVYALIAKVLYEEEERNKETKE